MARKSRRQKREEILPYRTFSINEACEYIHLPQPDVERLVRQNQIPFESQGHRLIFRKIDLDAWLSQRILGLNDKLLDDYHKTISIKPREHAASRHFISELTKKTAINIDLASRTKPSLLRDMVAMADKSGLLLNPKDLRQSLEEREKMCSTALVDGFALLHPRHHDPYMFETSFIALGRTIRAIPFGATDGRETDIFFLICCQNDLLHLRVLARLCIMCQRKGFLAGLRKAKDPAEIYECLCREESQVIK